jgi:hypothetical protein
MKRLFTFFPLLLLAFPLVADDAPKPPHIAVTWQVQPVAKTPVADALRLTVTDADGKPKKDAKVKVTSFRGDAKFFTLQEGTSKAAAEVTETTDANGNVTLGVLSGDTTLMQANAALVDDPTVHADIDHGVSSATAECDGTDCRDKTNFSFYTGVAIDSFASEAYNDKFNKDVTNASKTSPVFGIDFSHRFFETKKGRKWWVYGETLHYSRTTEVACQGGKPKPTTSAVKPTADSPGDANNPCSTQTNTPDNATDYTALLRGASTTEAFVGLRFEPWTLETSVVYTKLQLGFMTIAGNGGDIIDNHHIGAGIMVSNGKLRDSYIEVGHGQTDLFKEHRKNRWKFDGYVAWDPLSTAGNRSLLTPFLQMVVDSDFKKGADSVQIFAGMNIALDSMKVLIGK